MRGPRDRLEGALQPRGDGATLAVEQGMAEEEAEREREEFEDELDQDPFENWYGSYPI